MTITKPDDVWRIGPHRLMCADSSDLLAIHQLMGDQRPDLIFTSPPYSNLRSYLTYDESKWDMMMQSVFAAVPHHDGTQIIVNLGMVHKNNEIVWYWNHWLEHMKTTGWRNTGLYIWDKIHGMCGNHHGRLAPAFEMLFHFNKSTRQPNKTKAKKPSSINDRKSSTIRQRDGTTRPLSSPETRMNTHKIPDSVIRLQNEKANRTNHPAVFPVTLPMELIEAYTEEHQVVFDPFCGSGTTIIAAHKLNRVGYGIDIAPEYCDVAVARIQRETGLLAYRQDGETYDHLCHPEFFASNYDRQMALRLASWIGART